ncbi:hypothetical protein J3E69DRAFT_179558 [Trichoderma sp. SZMC 28015]
MDGVRSATSSRLILSVYNAMSELQPLLSSTRRRTSTDYTELLPDRHGLAPRFSALSHVHLHPQLETSTAAHMRCYPSSPWVQCRPCTRRRALLAWPGLASRLHQPMALHVLTARSALATSPAGRASNWRLRHFGTSRRCDDDSTAPRHFVTGRFSRPFLGNWEPRLLSFASPPLRTSLMNDDHGDEFYMLIDLLLYYPFTSLWPPFRNLLLSIASPMHALPTFFFFFFFYWAARRIPLGGAEPQATNSLAQKRCVRPVHLRDRGLCLSLGFSRKKKKTLACRAASDTKKSDVLGFWHSH